MSCDYSIEEQSINLAVAQITAEKLVDRGYEVDIFRGDAEGTLPKSQIAGYRADAFVALHTDWCSPGNSGFKVSRYGGDVGTGLNGSGDMSDLLVTSLWNAYSMTTGLAKDEETGHFMRYYWALDSAVDGLIGVRPPDESCQLVPGLAMIDSETPGAIIEMGWLSDDLAFMISPEGQDRMAQQRIWNGTDKGVREFVCFQFALVVRETKRSESVL